MIQQNMLGAFQAKLYLAVETAGMTESSVRVTNEQECEQKFTMTSGQVTYLRGAGYINFVLKSAELNRRITCRITPVMMGLDEAFAALQKSVGVLNSQGWIRRKTPQTKAAQTVEVDSNQASPLMNYVPKVNLADRQTPKVSATTSKALQAYSTLNALQGECVELLREHHKQVTNLTELTNSLSACIETAKVLDAGEYVMRAIATAVALVAKEIEGHKAEVVAITERVAQLNALRHRATSSLSHEELLRTFNRTD